MKKRRTVSTAFLRNNSAPFHDVDIALSMELSVAHIDVPERTALLFVPYPHGRDAAVGSVMVHAIFDVALGVGRVGT